MRILSQTISPYLSSSRALKTYRYPSTHNLSPQRVPGNLGDGRRGVWM